MEALEEKNKVQPHLREAHKALAREVITFLHGEEAFEEALACTNDPECLHNMPSDDTSNGAACHSCCMVSETACENGNRMLDRGLIIPLTGRENDSYFKGLVAKLCQLKI